MHCSQPVWKKLWALILVLAIMLPSVSLAAKNDEFKALRMTYIYRYTDEASGRPVRVRDRVRAGSTLKLGAEEEIGLEVQDAFQGNYRVQITGSTAEGTPFEYNDMIKVRNDGDSGSCSLRVSDRAGVYGPVTIHVTSDSGQQLRFEDIYFSRDEDAPNAYGFGFMHDNWWNSYGISPRGAERHVLPGEFYAETVENSLQITAPLEGSIMTGRVGYQMNVSAKIPRMSGTATVELRHKATQEVIASNKDKVDDYDSVHCELMIKNPFISGDVYELVVKIGDYQGIANITLADEDIPVEGFELPDLYYETDSREKVYLSSLTPDENGYIHIPQGSDGYLTLSVADAREDMVYRCELRAKGPRGEFATMGSDIGGSWCVTRTKISSDEGVYGPVHMTFMAGGQKREYDLMVTVAKRDDPYYAPSGLWNGGYTPARFEEIPQGLTITYPVDNTVLSGRQGMNLHINTRDNDLQGTMRLELREVGTDRLVASLDIDTSSGTSVLDLPINSYFTGGGEYDLIATCGEYKDSVRLRLMDEDINPYTPYASDLVEPVSAYLAQMASIEAGAEVDFEKYRFDAQDDGQGILGSFSMWQPWVEEATWQEEIADLRASANWTVYDTYRFQVRNMAKYTDAQPIHTQVLTDAFGYTWQELSCFKSAQGRTEKEGVQYLWLPVYYKDEQGGILEDRVYLYCVIAAPGADMSYLEDKIFYHEQAEYNVEKLLIADQKWVADFIRLMDEQTGFLTQGAEAKKYDKLSLGSHSLQVRKLQLKLIEMGFMMASADGYYGEQTVEAVKAYQEAAGLEATGTAGQKTQEMLLSQAVEKELLKAWLERHP